MLVSSVAERMPGLVSTLSQQERELSSLSGRVEVLGSSLKEVRGEALLVAGRINASVEVVRRARERVGEVRVGTEEVRANISQITTNVRRADETVMDTQQRCQLILPSFTL